MLVHKRTLGVLQWYWDGVSYENFNGVSVPKMAPVTRESHGLNADEWWQVPNGTALARRIALNYPFFDPVVEGDQLVDALVWPLWRRCGEPEEPAAVKPPRRGKYNRRRNAPRPCHSEERPLCHPEERSDEGSFYGRPGEEDSSGFQPSE